MKKRVGFVIGGTQKGGTTALHAYLSQHPEIGMSRKKEVHYFDKYFDRKKPFCGSFIGYARYHRYFSFSRDKKIHGEATPAYMYRYNVPERIWRYNPQMKWILLLRNPLERAYSHWNMQVEKGKEKRPFLQAAMAEPEKCRRSLRQCHSYSYIARGFYTEQLRRILRHFPREQLLVLRSEALLSAPENILPLVWKFLGVGTAEIMPLSKEEAHVRSYSRSMSKEEFALLHHIYEYEIRQLERMLDWGCEDWLNPSTARQPIQ